MNDIVFVDNFDVAFVIRKQLFDGRTDPLAIRSGEFKGLYDGDLGVLGTNKGGGAQFNRID